MNMKFFLIFIILLNSFSCLSNKNSAEQEDIVFTHEISKEVVLEASFFMYQHFGNKFDLYIPREADILSVNLISWKDLGPINRGSFINVMSDDPIEDNGQLWFMDRLSETNEGVQFSVRPHDEFFQDLWKNDLDLNQAFQGLDIRRPPVRAEIIFSY